METQANPGCGNPCCGQRRQSHSENPSKRGLRRKGTGGDAATADITVLRRRRSWTIPAEPLILPTYPHHTSHNIARCGALDLFASHEIRRLFKGEQAVDATAVIFVISFVKIFEIEPCEKRYRRS